MIDALTTDRSGRVSAQWRTFRAYWLGLTVSTIGDSFTLVALPIAAYTINRSSVLVGFVDMMEILSGVLLGSFLGIVAEHVRRRRLAHRAAFRSSSHVSNTRSLPKTCSVGPTSTHVKPACS